MVVNSDGVSVKRDRADYIEASEEEWSYAWGVLDRMIEELAQARDHAERQWRTFPGNDGYRLARKDGT